MLSIYDFYDDGVTVRVRFEPYYSEKVGMLAVTGFRAECRPGGEGRVVVGSVIQCRVLILGVLL